MFCIKTATDVTWLKNALKKLNENNVGTVQDRGPKKDFVIAVQLFNQNVSLNTHKN